MTDMCLAGRSRRQLFIELLDVAIFCLGFVTFGLGIFGLGALAFVGWHWYPALALGLIAGAGATATIVGLYELRRHTQRAESS